MMDGLIVGLISWTLVSFVIFLVLLVGELDFAAFWRRLTYLGKGVLGVVTLFLLPGFLVMGSLLLIYSLVTLGWLGWCGNMVKPYLIRSIEGEVE